MKLLCVVISLATFSCNHVGFSLSHYPKSAYKQKHVLGPGGNYKLEWEVNWEEKLVRFNISAKCKGYIGMGLSKTGSIADSDFVIGGISTNGKPYFTDMHGLPNGTLREDYRNDWMFLDAHRKENRIYLSFARRFETCDSEDLPISKDLVHVIWAYGETDEITLFIPNHGNKTFYLLDPDQTTEIANNAYRQIGPHSNLYLMQRFSAHAIQMVPMLPSSQMCSIIKGPQLSSKHYILGGGAYLPYNSSKTHVRQIVLSRCSPLEGEDATINFDSLVAQNGEDCKSFQNLSSPKNLCTEIIFVWGFGGQPFYFPEEVGIPIGMSPNEYFLLEILYQNSERTANVTVKAGLDLMFHPRPRLHEAGVQMVGYGPNGLFTIPPRAHAFSIYGHCSTQCTNDLLPQNGHNVIAVMFQMQSKGNIVRLRHFRGTTELPWIMNDDNYDGSYQQIRLLSESVTVLPGDQLTIQCIYDTFAIPNTTISGPSTNQERCTAYLLVNQRVTSAWCSSEYPIDKQLQYLGQRSWAGNATSQNANGSTISFSSGDEVIKYAVKTARWSPSARAALQREMLHGLQTASCPTHNQVGRSSRARKFPIIPTRNRKGQYNFNFTIMSSFTTPFAGGLVTIPTISLEHRPKSECQRSGAPINNFGFHRNPRKGLAKMDAKKSKTSNSLHGSTGNEKTMHKVTVERFRRING